MPLATKISVSDARKAFADLVNQVHYTNDRIILTKHGNVVAAIVPVHDLVELEDLDEEDKVLAAEVLAEEDPRERVSLAELRAELARRTG